MLKAIEQVFCRWNADEILSLFVNPSPGNGFCVVWRQQGGRWNYPRHISSSRARSDKITTAIPMFSGVKLSSSGTSNFVGRPRVLEIQDGSQITGSSNISETMTYIIRHSTMANPQEVYLGDSNSDRQSEMVAETGSTYISKTMKGTVKIPTTNLRYKTMYRWEIVLASKYNSDWQPEIPIWPPKPKIITSGTLTDSVKIANAKFRIFDDDKLDKGLAKCLRQRSTTIYKNCKIDAQNV